MLGEFDTISCDASGVLPVQISVGARWDADTSGPRALMLAVLEDAVQCIAQGRRCRRFNVRRLAADAEVWVGSDRRDWPFSFVNICEVLGLDPDGLRTRLLTMPKDAAHGRSVRVRAPIRFRTMTLAPELRRAAVGSTR